MANKAPHSKESSEWYTPPWVIEGFEYTFGQKPDFDPASCELANRIVQACAFLSKEGLETPWPMNPTVMFMNPPTPPEFWWTSFAKWQNVEAQRRGMYVGYSIEQLAQTQGWTPDTPLMSFPHCVPRQRMRFWCTVFQMRRKVEKRIDTLEEKRSTHDGDEAELKKIMQGLKPLWRLQEKLRVMPGDELVEGDAPPHANVIVLLGCKPGGRSVARFAEYFGHYGTVSRGRS